MQEWASEVDHCDDIARDRARAHLLRRDVLEAVGRGEGLHVSRRAEVAMRRTTGCRARVAHRRRKFPLQVRVRFEPSDVGIANRRCEVGGRRGLADSRNVVPIGLRNVQQRVVAQGRDPRRSGLCLHDETHFAIARLAWIRPATGACEARPIRRQCPAQIGVDIHRQGIGDVCRRQPRRPRPLLSA